MSILIKDLIDLISEYSDDRYTIYRALNIDTTFLNNLSITEIISKIVNSDYSKDMFKSIKKNIDIEELIRLSSFEDAITSICCGSGSIKALEIIERDGYLSKSKGQGQANNSCVNGYLDCLEWYKTRGFLPNIAGLDLYILYEYVIDVKILDWCKSNNIIPTSSSAYNAFYNGNIDYLNWMKNNVNIMPDPSNIHSCIGTSSNEKEKLKLNWAIENNYIPNYKWTLNACENGCINDLEWLKKNGFLADFGLVEEKDFLFILRGRINIITWLKNNVPNFSNMANEKIEMIKRRLRRSYDKELEFIINYLEDRRTELILRL